jgi:aspartyl-tRNA(Asn)/glutamyl-tRNA(Gln) amidotransferase subunit C
MTITEQEVRRVAELAQLALTDDEVVQLAHDMSRVLTHVEKLNELDTSQVAPMAQVLYEAPDAATLREDIERAPLSNAEAVANAPLAGAGYFKVPRVIER